MFGGYIDKNGYLWTADCWSSTLPEFLGDVSPDVRGYTNKRLFCEGQLILEKNEKLIEIINDIFLGPIATTGTGIGIYPEWWYHSYFHKHRFPIFYGHLNYHPSEYVFYTSENGGTIFITNKRWIYIQNPWRGIPLPFSLSYYNIFYRVFDYYRYKYAEKAGFKDIYIIEIDDIANYWSKIDYRIYHRLWWSRYSKEKEKFLIVNLLVSPKKSYEDWKIRGQLVAFLEGKSAEIVEDILNKYVIEKEDWVDGIFNKKSVTYYWLKPKDVVLAMVKEFRQIKSLYKEVIRINWATGSMCIEQSGKICIAVIGDEDSSIYALTLFKYIGTINGKMLIISSEEPSKILLNYGYSPENTEIIHLTEDTSVEYLSEKIINFLEKVKKSIHPSGIFIEGLHKLLEKNLTGEEIVKIVRWIREEALRYKVRLVIAINENCYERIIYKQLVKGFQKCISPKIKLKSLVSPSTKL